MNKGKTNLRYSEEFREKAVGRMLGGANVKELSRELKVSRSVLFDWRKKAVEGVRFEKEERRKDREIGVLRSQIQELEAAVGRKSQEVDFLESALRRVGAAIPTGTKASARRSTGGWSRKAN